MLILDAATEAGSWHWQIDQQGLLVRVSHHLRAQMPDNLPLPLGRFLTVFADGNRETSAWSRLRQLMENHRPVTGLIVPASIGQKCQNWSISATPLRDESGHHAGYIGVCLAMSDDIVEATGSQSSQRGMQPHLHTRMLNSMKHGLRTNLASIIEFADLMKASPHRPLSDSTHQDFADLISRNALELNEAMSDLLEVARMESGDLELSSQLVDFAEIVQTAANRCSSTSKPPILLSFGSDARNDYLVNGDLSRLSRMMNALFRAALTSCTHHDIVSARLERDHHGGCVTLVLQVGRHTHLSDCSAQETDEHSSGDLNLLADTFGPPIAIAGHLARLHGGYLNVTRRGLGTLKFEVSLKAFTVTAAQSVSAHVQDCKSQASQRLRRL